MEDALARMTSALTIAAQDGLNPCSNGRCTRTGPFIACPSIRTGRLNPCSNGRCTRTLWEFWYADPAGGVLILVLMEDALARG